MNILPKARYVHTESPSRHVKNEDRPQRAPPRIKVFGHLQLLTCKVVYIFNIRPSHIYTCFNRFDVVYDVLNGSVSPRVTGSLCDRWPAPCGKDLAGSLPKTLPGPHGTPRHLPGSPPQERPKALPGNPTFHSRMDKTVTT